MGLCNIVRSLTRKDVVDAIYPVGSIYMSVNSTSPAVLFGGVRGNALKTDF